MANVPKVMISSTFYDLRQVRADLTRFLGDEVGCIPLVSELPSFPIDPEFDTVENCRRRVEEDADVLILIMGGRYGSVDRSSARSVTNLEYLAARVKGIPVYAFISKEILALLPVWRKNPTADFSGAVDDTRIFKFIEQVRSEDGVWTQEFELAEQIVVALRSHFALLMTEGLQFRRRRRDQETFRILEELSGAPLRIALEKPAGWQYKLFAELLRQEIAQARALRHGQRLGISYGAHEWVSLREAEAWGRSRLAEVMALVHSSETIINLQLPAAWGELDQPGDLEMIVFCARQLGGIYREAIEWSQRVRRVSGEDAIVSIAEGMTPFTRDIIDVIEALGPQVTAELEALLAAVARGEDPVRTVRFSIDLPGADAVSQAIEELAEQLAKRGR